MEVVLVVDIFYDGVKYCIYQVDGLRFGIVYDVVFQGFLVEFLVQYIEVFVEVYILNFLYLFDIEFVNFRENFVRKDNWFRQCDGDEFLFGIKAYVKIFIEFKVNFKYIDG